MKKIKCDYCGKYHLHDKYRLKINQNNFCSRICCLRFLALKRTIPYKTMKCEYCGMLIRDFKRRNRKFCSFKCMGKKWCNKILTECNYCKKEFLRRRTQKGKNTFCSLECKYKYSIENYSGKKSWSWRGGLTQIGKAIRNSQKYKDYHYMRLKLDNFVCQLCGKRGGKLEVHHKKPFGLIIIENKIKTIYDAYNCNELWDPSNGQTICKKCHEQTETFGSKGFRLIQIAVTINQERQQYSIA